MIVDMSSALQRVGKVAGLLGVDGDPLRHGDGWSNHAWLYQDVVIRVAARPGPGTLHQEAALGPRLPTEVGYPRLLGHGVIDGHQWMAQVRLPGDNLAAVWDELDSANRSVAVADLWARLAHLRHADMTGLVLPPTPLYAFSPTTLSTQVAEARSIVGDRIMSRVDELIDKGRRATSSVPSVLVHTDAVLANAVWTGFAAIPIDFEFACVGPVDLDVDCVGREVVGRADPMAIDRLRGALTAVLDNRGATDRLRYYSLLRDLWAIGKWIQNDPTRTDAHAWAPVQDLVADVERSGWLDRLLY